MMILPFTLRVWPSTLPAGVLLRIFILAVSFQFFFLWHLPLSTCSLLLPAGKDFSVSRSFFSRGQMRVRGFPALISIFKKWWSQKALWVNPIRASELKDLFSRARSRPIRTMIIVSTLSTRAKDHKTSSEMSGWPIDSRNIPNCENWSG